MRFRTCFGLYLVVGSAGFESSGCSAPTANSSAFPPTDAGASPFSEGGSSGGDAGIALNDAGDASACFPGSVSSFVPAYDPSSRYADACTADQLAAVIRDCFDPSTDSQKACDAWGSNSKNRGCLDCWSGPVTIAPSSATSPPTSTWAPYLYVDSPGETTYVNLSGCIVLAAPSQLNCAEDIQYEFACDLVACEANCPIPISGSAASAETALRDCFISANAPMGVCSTYASAATSCMKALQSSGPAAFCFEAENEQPLALLQFFALSCGASPPVGADASVEDGAASPDTGSPASEAGDAASEDALSHGGGE